MSTKKPISIGDLKKRLDIGDLVLLHCQRQEQIGDHGPTRNRAVNYVGYVVDLKVEPNGWVGLSSCGPRKGADWLGGAKDVRTDVYTNTTKIKSYEILKRI